MSFTVIFDACVLFPAPLRDLLIRLGQTGLLRARWTDRILDKCFASLLSQRPDLDTTRLKRTRQLMVAAIPDCMVTGYKKIVSALDLPDENDRHVLAAAIRVGAQVIVTHNIKDFPTAVLDELGIEALEPDEFVVNVIDLDGEAVATVVREQADDLKNPPTTVDQLLVTLEQQGLPRSVAAVRPYVAVGQK